jgi:hypothetical protein
MHDYWLETKISLSTKTKIIKSIKKPYKNVVIVKQVITE